MKYGGKMGGIVRWSELLDPESWDIMPPMGIINEKTGTVNVYELLPEQGDMLVITNHGTHFEVRHYNVLEPPLGLTEDDVARIQEGLMTWH